MTVDWLLARPPTAANFSSSGDFGGPFQPTLFAQASEAARNCRPGYSWRPHLYQERFQAT